MDRILHIGLNGFKIEGGNKVNNIIEVKNLTKEYKGLKAINDLSFEVHEGEILGLLRTKWKWKINNH